MPPVEEFAFLDPWHRIIPDRGVVAIAGSGGCTTALLALLEVWRRRGVSVLVSQTTAHPVPFGLLDLCAERDVSALRRNLETSGLAVAASGSGEDRSPGLAPEELERLRTGAGADVLVVQAQDSTGHLLRAKHSAPVWPLGTGLAVLVAQVGCAGRLWTAATGEPDRSDPPRRVEVPDLVKSLQPLLAVLPDGARPLPFLTGLGAWRDLDGMFSIVQEFWDDPRVWVVALAELVGDERREEADLRGVPAGVAMPFEGDRIYAVYPAALDEA
jgi:hypothetical protein